MPDPAARALATSAEDLWLAEDSEAFTMCVIGDPTRKRQNASSINNLVRVLRALPDFSEKSGKAGPPSIPGTGHPERIASE
jgi:hypothetical protein